MSKTGMKTVNEVSKVTGLSKSFIRHLARTGKIKSERIGERMFLVDLMAVVNEDYVIDDKRRSYNRGNKS